MSRQDGVRAPGAVRWRRSSSCYDGNCVEVAVVEDAVLVRDSKSPDGGEISVNFRDWAVFMEFVRDTCQGESLNPMVAGAGAVPRPGRAAGWYGRADRIRIRRA